MPDRLRPHALRRLAGEAAGLRVVVTSRPGEYRAALQDGEGLPYPAVVHLRPVGPAAAARYLLEGRTGSSRQLWQQVADRLQADSGGVLAQVLTTPLTLSLARAVGPDRPGCYPRGSPPARRCTAGCGTRPWSAPTPTSPNVPTPSGGWPGSPTT